MTKLTKRQQEILSLIQNHMANTGSPPTRAEIAKTMGFKSPNAAEDHLRALARKGVIELVPGTSRGIRLSAARMGLPIIKMSQLDPSQPLFQQAAQSQTCKLDRAFFKPSVDYLIACSHKGNVDLGMTEGDLVAIHNTQNIQVGQTALFRSNHEITIRRFTPDHAQHLTIEGLVVGIIRPFTEITTL